MYEQFTGRAKRVMQLAGEEARSFNHEWVGTEHVLLGLIREGTGVAACALRNLGVDLRRAREKVGKHVPRGGDEVVAGELPQAPQVEEVVRYAKEEAGAFKHLFVGTEHLLLGLLRAEDHLATRVLVNLGLKLEEVRGETLALLGQGEKGAANCSADPMWEVRLVRFKDMVAKVTDENGPTAAELAAALAVLEDSEYWRRKLFVRVLRPIIEAQR